MVQLLVKLLLDLLHSSASQVGICSRNQLLSGPSTLILTQKQKRFLQYTLKVSEKQPRNVRLVHHSTKTKLDSATKLKHLKDDNYQPHDKVSNRPLVSLKKQTNQTCISKPAL